MIKSKKLIMINLFFLIAFLFVMSSGIHKAEAERSSWGEGKKGNSKKGFISRNNSLKGDFQFKLKKIDKITAFFGEDLEIVEIEEEEEEEEGTGREEIDLIDDEQAEVITEEVNQGGNDQTTNWRQSGGGTKVILPKPKPEPDPDRNSGQGSNKEPKPEPEREPPENGKSKDENNDKGKDVEEIPNNEDEPEPGPESEPENP